jgi:hypothetical protein
VREPAERDVLIDANHAALEDHVARVQMLDYVV